MKYRNLYQHENAEINITPMLDVVFIMLIFFIVTTSFIKETGLGLFKSNNSTLQNHKVKNAIIKLDAQNNHSVNGVATTLDGIKSLLANLKNSNPDIVAQIISSKEVKIDNLVPVSYTHLTLPTICSV